MDHPQSRRGESSKPIRYNPVPIGGPDRPPVTQSPTASPLATYTPSPDRRGSYAERRNKSLIMNLGSPGVKREPGLRDGSEHQSEPQSAVTDYTERSSTAYPESRDNGVKSEDPDGDGELLRKKQKRNKPTLSCFECVERKTKVGLCSLSPSLLTSSHVPSRASVLLPGSGD